MKEKIKAIAIAIAKREVAVKNNREGYNWISGNEYVPTPTTNWKLKNDLSNIGEIVAESLVWPSAKVFPHWWEKILSDWVGSDKYMAFSDAMKPAISKSPYNGDRGRFLLELISREEVISLLPEELIEELDYLFRKMKG